MHKLETHVSQCLKVPWKCVECQIHKLTDGLMSGRYSYSATSKTDFSAGIKPLAIKSMIAKKHPEFSTMKQQDALEYLAYFKSQLEKQSSIKNVGELFEIVQEERIQCMGCMGVKYKESKDDTMSLFCPLRKQVEPKSEQDSDVYHPIAFQECMDGYFDVGFGEGYYCEECKTLTIISP